MSAGAVIDINADVGERPGATEPDRELMRSLSSANIACGFHAGDATTMRIMCETAAELGIAVGAHFSYRDREGFGRRELEVAGDELAAEIVEQVATLRAAAASCGTVVRYVKAHGALYNASARDPDLAALIAAAVASLGPLPILCLPASQLARAGAEHGLKAVAEGFADRLYTPDGALTPRGSDGAVLDHEAAVAQALALATGSEVRARGGALLRLRVRSICLHSDTPGAPALAAAVRQAVLGAGVGIEAFA